MATEKFTCPACGHDYGDPLYHGPAGHAPPESCLDCWAQTWGEMSAAMARGRAGRGKADWRRPDLALFYLCHGLTRRQVAEKAGVHRNTIYNWLKKMRQHPEAIPAWFVDWATSGGEKK